MSLELISLLKKPITEDLQNEIATSISQKGYKQVYHYVDYNSRGFTTGDTPYLPDYPPLFEIIITENHFSLAVYGDLNDLSKIHCLAQDILSEMNIEVNFYEPGEE